MQSIIQFLPGRCENCRFRGLVARRNMVPQSEIDRLKTDPLATVYSRDMTVCYTCFFTPSGCKSDNLNHSRLPDAEYKEAK